MKRKKKKALDETFVKLVHRWNRKKPSRVLTVYKGGKA